VGKLSRTKGHSFERNIAQDFQEIGFPDARRHLEYQQREANGCDLSGVEPFKVQCKRKKSYSPITAIFEVTANRDAGEIPLLITKGDRQETMAVLPWSELKRLLDAS